jgi:hypothetical protein
MVGQGEQPTEKTTKEIAREAEEEIARAARLAQEADKGTRGRLRMKLGMVFLHGNTTQSLTNNAQPAKIDSKTDHGRSARNSTESSTKENSSTARQHTMP